MGGRAGGDCGVGSLNAMIFKGLAGRPWSRIL